MTTNVAFSPWRLCVAPMMDWTDRHCRFFHRLLTKHTRLYTEMVTTGALIHGDRARHLDFNTEEHPVALQLGGSDPSELAACAKLADDWGYDEVNLNCGCPSPRVLRGSFGACLMAEPQLVAACVKAMRDSANVAVTVKHRIGIDDIDDYGFVRDFVGTVADAGCHVFIIHARNAILQGLSPKQNREVPPLKYERAYRLKQDFPRLTIVLNGGVADNESIHAHLQHVDGVMVGRAAYRDPYLLATWDTRFFGTPVHYCEREQVEIRMHDYIVRCTERDARFHPHSAQRHMVGLYKGLSGARAWRRRITGNTLERIAEALALREG